MDYSGIEGLSNEIKQRLAEACPASLAHAARIPGMTAAGLSVLLVHARRARSAQPEKKQREKQKEQVSESASGSRA
jgi:tRNA uridine 5-carboxymethylaminomethyl modification enzyme